MPKIAYFDCYSGASGDMLLGALLDSAIDFEWFQNELSKLNLPEKAIKIEKTYEKRSSINSCKINITLNNHDHAHRDYNEICTIINKADINETAKKLSQKIFSKLAKAEATIHNKKLEEIHFHEVGALDSIVDIIGFSICYSSLKIDKCIVSPIPIGFGITKCAHGYLPVPAPATLEILKDSILKIDNKKEIEEECLTPTGASILSSIVDESSYITQIDKIESIGYGAGNKIFNETITSNLRFLIGSTN